MNNKHKFTNEGLESIKSRLKYLKEVDRPRVVEALKEARAQGDLSENAEYDAARDEQARIEQEITELEEIVKTAVVISEDVHTSNIGKYVTVTMSYKKSELKNETKTFLLVSSSLEANPKEDKISIESPLGKALYEANVGFQTTLMEGTDFEYKLVVKKIANTNKK